AICRVQTARHKFVIITLNFDMVYFISVNICTGPRVQLINQSMVVFWALYITRLLRCIYKGNINELGLFDGLISGPNIFVENENSEVVNFHDKSIEKGILRVKSK
ncbi:14723_t:CDS:1, partial [Dentiscutata heterogama]